MRSDKYIYYILKYGLFILGGLTFLTLGIRHLFPYSGLFKDPEPPEPLDTTIIILVGLALLLGPLWYIRHLVRVEVSDQYILISTRGEVLRVPWSDVESIEMQATKFFPVYKLKIKNNNAYFLFTTKNWGRQLFWSESDWSDMGELIMRKKKELSI